MDTNTMRSLAVRYHEYSTTAYLEDQNFPSVFSQNEVSSPQKSTLGTSFGSLPTSTAKTAIANFELANDTVSTSFAAISTRADLGTMAFSETSLGTNWWNNLHTSSNFTNKTLSDEECQEILQGFRENNYMVFNYTQLVRVYVTWTVFLLSAIGNVFVLSSVTFRRRRKHISHSQLIMMHLTFANLAFTFFILPVDAIWVSTLEWKGGDALCRVTNILKQFAMYISSAIIVVMGVDRVATLMCQTSAARQRQRIRTMLIVAWVFSFLNAIPAGAIFSQLDHHPRPRACPDHYVTQCVDLEVQRKANLEAYYVYTMFISFFGPLICILVCYLFIAISISRMARISKEAQRRCSMKNRGSGKSVTKRSLDRARRVSQIVTGLITATFILCWGPYYVVGLKQWFEKSSQSSLKPMAQALMIMSMYLNPCLHPLITVLMMKEVRSNIFMQCRKTSYNGRLPPKKVSAKKKKSIVVKNDKCGTKEQLLLENMNARNGRHCNNIDDV